MRFYYTPCGSFLRLILWNYIIKLNTINNRSLKHGFNFSFVIYKWIGMNKLMRKVNLRLGMLSILSFFNVIISCTFINYSCPTLSKNHILLWEMSVWYSWRKYYHCYIWKTVAVLCNGNINKCYTLMINYK